MNRTDGFSLVEMLVALAVLSIAGLALMNAMTTGVRAATLAQETALAGLAADNVLGLQIVGERGQSLRSRSGRYELGGTEFDWTLEVERAPGSPLDRVTLVLVQDERELVRRTTFVRAR